MLISSDISFDDHLCNKHYDPHAPIPTNCLHHSMPHFSSMIISWEFYYWPVDLWSYSLINSLNVWFAYMEVSERDWLLGIQCIKWLVELNCTVSELGIWQEFYYRLLCSSIQYKCRTKGKIKSPRKFAKRLNFYIVENSFWHLIPHGLFTSLCFKMDAILQCKIYHLTSFIWPREIWKVSICCTSLKCIIRKR